MRLGVIVYSTETGLGYQSFDYYHHLNPKKALHIDISSLNGKEQHYNWYGDNTMFVKGIPNRLQIAEFLKGLDVVLMAETPLNYELYDIARKMGVKTANVINYEFFDHLVKPELPLPDLIIMPSVWYFKEMQQFCKSKGIGCVQLHHPVDRDLIPFRLRHTVKTMHLAGNPAALDRNGTADYMTACPDGRVVTQSHDLANKIRSRYSQSNVFTDIHDQKIIYSIGDIMVMPRKYGGNCLPLNEALSAGMPVIMPDISPNNHLLPKEWLVPAYVAGSFTPRTKIDVYQTDIQALRDKIDWFATQDIKHHSELANKIADSISWTTLKPEWEATIADLCNSPSRG